MNQFRKGVGARWRCADSTTRSAGVSEARLRWIRSRRELLTTMVLGGSVAASAARLEEEEEEEERQPAVEAIVPRTGSIMSDGR